MSRSTAFPTKSRPPSIDSDQPAQMLSLIGIALLSMYCKTSKLSLDGYQRRRLDFVASCAGWFASSLGAQAILKERGSPAHILQDFARIANLTVETCLQMELYIQIPRLHGLHGFGHCLVFRYLYYNVYLYSPGIWVIVYKGENISLINTFRTLRDDCFSSEILV